MTIGAATLIQDHGAAALDISPERGTFHAPSAVHLPIGGTMLGSKQAAATVAVRDLTAAKRFYETMLGLKQIATEGQEAVVYATTGSKLVVYRSQFAGTNQATGVTWNVGDDIDGVVRDLKSKGVTFEHYDMPGMKREGDIHIAGGTRAAWFKDPDGNIHSLVNR
jgi:catechol 2,3-dioxygenase-like lactoylglutathione lyase family enzyme